MWSSQHPLPSPSSQQPQPSHATRQYDIIVETLTGSEFEVTVTDNDTVFYIKSRIHKYEGIPVHQQHLLHANRELQDSIQLKDIPLLAGGRLKLVLGMRGGPILARRVASLPDNCDRWFDMNDPLQIATTPGVKLAVYKDNKGLVKKGHHHHHHHRIMKMGTQPAASSRRLQATDGRMPSGQDVTTDEQWLKDNADISDKMQDIREKLDRWRKRRIILEKKKDSTTMDAAPPIQPIAKEMTPHPKKPVAEFSRAVSRFPAIEKKQHHELAVGSGGGGGIGSELKNSHARLNGGGGSGGEQTTNNAGGGGSPYFYDNRYSSAMSGYNKADPVIYNHTFRTFNTWYNEFSEPDLFTGFEYDATTSATAAPVGANLDDKNDTSVHDLIERFSAHSITSSSESVSAAETCNVTKRVKSAQKRFESQMCKNVENNNKSTSSLLGSGSSSNTSSFMYYKMAQDANNYELPKLMVREDSPVDSIQCYEAQLETLTIAEPKTNQKSAAAVAARHSDEHTTALKQHAGILDDDVVDDGVICTTDARPLECERARSRRGGTSRRDFWTLKSFHSDLDIMNMKEINFEYQDSSFKNVVLSSDDEGIDDDDDDDAIVRIDDTTSAGVGGGGCGGNNNNSGGKEKTFSSSTSHLDALKSTSSKVNTLHFDDCVRSAENLDPFACDKSPQCVELKPHNYLLKKTNRSLQRNYFPNFDYFGGVDEVIQVDTSGLLDDIVIPEVKHMDEPPKPPQRLRCAECNKKLALAMAMTCHCGRAFCARHRYAEAHNCSYDFKGEGRKTILADNPRVCAEKLPKI